MQIGDAQSDPGIRESGSEMSASCSLAAADSTVSTAVDSVAPSQKSVGASLGVGQGPASGSQNHDLLREQLRVICDELRLTPEHYRGCHVGELNLTRSERDLFRKALLIAQELCELRARLVLMDDLPPNDKASSSRPPKQPKAQVAKAPAPPTSLERRSRSAIHPLHQAAQKVDMGRRRSARPHKPVKPPPTPKPTPNLKVGKTASGFRKAKASKAKSAKNGDDEESEDVRQPGRVKGEEDEDYQESKSSRSGAGKRQPKQAAKKPERVKAKAAPANSKDPREEVSRKRRSSRREESEERDQENVENVERRTKDKKANSSDGKRPGKAARVPKDERPSGQPGASTGVRIQKLSPQEKAELQANIDKLNDDQLDRVFEFLNPELGGTDGPGEDVSLDLEVLAAERQRALVQVVAEELRQAGLGFAAPGAGAVDAMMSPGFPVVEPGATPSGTPATPRSDKDQEASHAKRQHAWEVCAAREAQRQSHLRELRENNLVTPVVTHEEQATAGEPRVTGQSSSTQEAAIPPPPPVPPIGIAGAGDSMLQSAGDVLSMLDNDFSSWM